MSMCKSLEALKEDRNRIKASRAQMVLSMVKVVRRFENLASSARSVVQLNQFAEPKKNGVGWKRCEEDGNGSSRFKRDVGDASYYNYCYYYYLSYISPLSLSLFVHKRYTNISTQTVQ